MPCSDCDLARDLERHIRLIADGLAEAREAKLLVLSPDEREAVKREEEFLSRLLARIEERRYSTA